jgi:hypothetical protein
MREYQAIDVQLTLQCNAACPNCGQLCNVKGLGLDYSGAALTDAQIEKCFSDIRAIGRKRIRTILLTGGEPLLHPRVEWAAEQAIKLIRKDYAYDLQINSNLILKAPAPIAPFIRNDSTPEENKVIHRAILLHPDDIPAPRPTWVTCCRLRCDKKATFTHKGWFACCAGAGLARLLKADHLYLDHLPRSHSGFPLEQMSDVCNHCSMGCANQPLESKVGAPVSEFYKKAVAK